mmetsp:Transcript_11551/g.24710  ORF Transcript_11551/g.24710 Transcript_11551/m.24710 type:complete len:125 (+) Transcript_11551:343-717(+)
MVACPSTACGIDSTSRPIGRAAMYPCMVFGGQISDEVEGIASRQFSIAVYSNGDIGIILILVLDFAFFHSFILVVFPSRRSFHHDSHSYCPAVISAKASKWTTMLPIQVPSPWWHRPSTSIVII